MRFWILENIDSGIETRPNQVRTLTVIKSLFQNTYNAANYLLVLYQIASKYSNEQNVQYNEQNVQKFITMNKMFKYSFKWTKCSKSRIISPEKVIPRTVWWRLKRLPNVRIRLSQLRPNKNPLKLRKTYFCRFLFYTLNFVGIT